MSKERRDEPSEVEMFVSGLVLDPASNAPIVLLKDSSGEIVLPIWIGLAEATAIASALKKVELARPMTHDLLKAAIDALGGRVLKVVISALQENTFFANLEIASGDAICVIDSRPSDAIAVAVRVGAPIWVSVSVLTQAQVTLVANPGEEGDEEGAAEGGIENNFASIDKDRWAEILSEMDPDDFKYKM